MTHLSLTVAGLHHKPFVESVQDWLCFQKLLCLSLFQSNQYPPNVHSINLTLVNVSRDDNSFMLTCIAENIVGMTNASIQLSVQCKCLFSCPLPLEYLYIQPHCL